MQRGKIFKLKIITSAFAFLCWECDGNLKGIWSVTFEFLVKEIQRISKIAQTFTVID